MLRRGACLRSLPPRKSSNSPKRRAKVRARFLLQSDSALFEFVVDFRFVDLLRRHDTSLVGRRDGCWGLSCGGWLIDERAGRCERSFAESGEGCVSTYSR